MLALCLHAWLMPVAWLHVSAWSPGPLAHALARIPVHYSKGPMPSELGLA